MEVATILKENISRDEADRESVLVQLSTELEMEKIRDVERMNMEANDPVISKFRSQDGFEGLKSHLIPISRVDVFKKISNDHGSNNVPTNPSDNGFEIFSFHAGEAHLTDFDTPESLAAAISDAHDGIYKNLRSIAILMARKDAHYSALRDELATEIIERKKREEEVVNWSYILKYLLGTISKLREKLSVEADVAGGGVRLLASLVNSTDASLPEKIHGSPQSLASVKFNEDGDYAGQSKVQKASSDFMNIPQYMPSDENRVRVTVGSGVSGIGSGKDNRDIKRFTSNAVDPRRRIVSDNPSGTSSRKSAFRNNIEPSPLERVSLRKDSADSKVGVRGFMFADVDQLGPPSDDSAHGNTTEYDDDERGGGANSPIGHYNNYEEASDAYRSDTFKSEITYSSYRDFPAKSKIMPSRFAQSVAQDLGVIGQEANATMSVIDQLALITDAEINAMDPDLKIQILEIRRQLGMTTKESRPVDAVKSVHNPIAVHIRSTSAGNQRSQSRLAAFALRDGSSVPKDREQYSPSRSVSVGTRNMVSSPNLLTPNQENSAVRFSKISFQQTDPSKFASVSGCGGSSASASSTNVKRSSSTTRRSAGTSKLVAQLQSSLTPMTKKYSQLDEMESWNVGTK